MRIEAAAAIIAAVFGATAVLPAAAEDLPQKSASEPVSHDVRRAAEELSAKFAGGTPQDTHTETRALQASPAYGVPADPKPRANSDAATADPKDRRSEARGLITGSLPEVAARAANRAGESKSRPRVADQAPQERVAELRRPRPPATWLANAVPGASTGWQTGIIGMLTNPAFWH